MFRIRRTAIILRPTPAAIAGIAAVAAVEAHGTQHSSVEAAIALPIAIAVMLGFAWNDIYDCGKDRIARREDKPLAAGQLDLRSIIMLTRVLFAIGALIAFFAIGTEGLLAFLSLCLLAYLYSPFARAYPSLKTVYAAALCIAPYVFVRVVYGTTFSPLLYIIVFLFFIFREIAIDGTEIVWDRRASYNTLSVALGERRSSVIGWGGMISMAVLMCGIAADWFGRLASSACLAVMLVSCLLCARFPVLALNLTRIPLAIMSVALPFIMAGQ